MFVSFDGVLKDQQGTNNAVEILAPTAADIRVRCMFKPNDINVRC